MKILLLVSDDVRAYYSASLMQGGHQIITHGGGVSRSENPAHLSLGRKSHPSLWKKRPPWSISQKWLVRRPMSLAAKNVKRNYGVQPIYSDLLQIEFNLGRKQN